MDAISFIVHDEPALRGESNYIARIDLAPFEFEGQVEQVWLRRIGDDGEAVLCCIPFRAYGLALRDTVRLSAESAVIELVNPSGSRALRALIAELDAGEIRVVKAEIDARVSRAGLLFEWSGDRHVAIDVPLGADAEAIMDYFDGEEAADRLYWEWSDVASFRV
ncbi:uncharacterized protein DUF4265 [Kribbella rubisoli]|uniref:Uncharacterized protein DUF4265 n=1 Tax=Kribbella rubisoli TaxID=3075929 RepID=A0A4Q7X6T5_9ACTN|nr:DUF4265 domain-containing protein [Kribbella rubisoli]RZU18782.1 uncharacterized protein DUF4265 [Kribbella rubisoli]